LKNTDYENARTSYYCPRLIWKTIRSRRSGSEGRVTRERVPEADTRMQEKLFRALERQGKLRLSSVLLFSPKIGF
jgi:hypothetical protein